MANPRFLQARFRSADPQQHTARYVIASEDVAADGDIVLASAFRRSRDYYLKNGAFLWHHPWLYDEWVGPRCVIGKPIAIDIFEDRGEVEGEFRYSVDAHEDARTAWELVQDGSLRTVSVGWFPVKYVTRKSPQADVDALPPKARQAILDGSCRAVHTDIDLFEVSQVYNPADKNAVRIRDFIQSRKQAEEDSPMPAVSTTDSAAPAAGAPHARIGHAPTNDIKHRLQGAIESLCCCGACGCCWAECCCPNACEPPEPDVCLGVIRVLDQVVEDLKDLAGADNDMAMADPVASSGVTRERQPQARQGKTLSAASRAQIQQALDAHEDGMKAHKRCARTLTDMIEAIEEDAEEDAEGDEDGARAAAPSLSAHFANLLKQRST